MYISAVVWTKKVRRVLLVVLERQVEQEEMEDESHSQKAVAAVAHPGLQNQPGHVNGENSNIA
jgi:hypothetical protein